MTTLCTLFGLLPLALGLGAGAELQKPLALAVIGGLALSTPVTLLAVPGLYAAINVDNVVRAKALLRVVRCLKPRPQIGKKDVHAQTSSLFSSCWPRVNVFARLPSESPDQEIPIGGDGGWDYITRGSGVPPPLRLARDEGRRRRHRHRQGDGEIPDTAGVHGFAVAPDLGRGFSSNGRANTSTIVDLETLKPVGVVATGGNPDAINHEPGRHEVYTMNGSGKSATVFEADTGKVVATIALGAKPEAVVAGLAAQRLFVNLEDTGAIGVIDIATQRWRPPGRWPAARNPPAWASTRRAIGCSAPVRTR